MHAHYQLPIILCAYCYYSASIARSERIAVDAPPGHRDKWRGHTRHGHDGNANPSIHDRRLHLCVGRASEAPAWLLLPAYGDLLRYAAVVDWTTAAALLAVHGNGNNNAFRLRRADPASPRPAPPSSSRA